MTDDEQRYEFPSVNAEGLLSPKVTFLEKYGISPVLFAFISLIIVFFLYQIVGGVISFLLFGINPTGENVSGFRIATGIGQLCFLFLPTLLLVRLASFNPGEYFRLRTPHPLTLMLPLIGIVSLQQMLQIYLVFQDKIPLPEELATELSKFKDLVEESYKSLIVAHSVPELLWVIVIIALIPAIAEEFLFRGLVQRSLESLPNPLNGVFLTGIIFGAYHLIPFSFVPLAILGMYLGFLVYRADNLWPAVAAHFYNNTIACVATYLQVDDDAIVTGNPNEMSLAMLLGTFWFFGVVFLISTYVYIRVTDKDDGEEDDDGGAGE
jgi:membrane protease YdiL (CAAX protease family)